MPTKPIAKVFLCYAREDPDPLDHFVDLFRNYNYDFKIFYDRTAYSGNMHKRFKNFAKTCDVALLLVNAKFINPDSYANIHEVPILKRRLKNRHVIVIGILMQDVNPIRWNADGDIYFFPLTYNDIPTARRSDEYRQKHNRQFIVYKSLNEKSWDTFHKELREWILVLLKDHLDLKPEPIEELDEVNKKLRTESDSEKVISKMTNYKFLSGVERKLSENALIWIESEIPPPLSRSSYAGWYFLKQSEWLTKEKEKIQHMELETFRKKRVLIEPQLQLRNHIMLELFEGVGYHECISEIEEFKTMLDDVFSELMKSNNSDAVLFQIKCQIYKYMETIINQLKELSHLASELTRSNSA